jgi:phosphoglycolate phosphatase
VTTRLAILDLDGTIIDSVEDIANAVNHGLSRAGLPTRSQEEIRGFVGDGALVLLERAVGARKDLLSVALEGWREHYAAHSLDHTRPYPGVEKLLAGARRTLAVQTNKPGEMARQILKGLGLLERFALVQGGGEAPKKPDPAGVQVILDRLGARPEDTVFVGDSPVDVATAKGAGLGLVAVTWGLSRREELLAAGAVHLVDRVEDLAPWLA